MGSAEVYICVSHRMAIRSGYKVMQSGETGITHMFRLTVTIYDFIRVSMPGMQTHS